ncbi:MAG: hypothetical protein ACYSWU_04925 [Planctomycetota bacterium]
MKISVVLLALFAVGITGCTGSFQRPLPPAQMLMEPGPGVGGPGPGVMMYQPSPVMPGRTSQILFVGPHGMRVTWDISAPGQFDSVPLICPGHYNFPQGAIYRLKLTHIPGADREGVELYPTLEVGPAVPRTEAFLAHNAIPIQFAVEDFDQVLTGNFVTKVIYLPDPEFQEFALAGVETLVSTRLDPGVDPIVEADRRGAILAIIRMGNKDLEIPSEMTEEGDVVQASYQAPLADGGMAAGPRPLGVPVGGPSTTPTTYISGVNGPQYGMPMCGTPIGLPGPPHVPLGIPAGLRKHSIKNHTAVRIPRPTHRVRVDVKQFPGMSYPKPPDRAFIQEQTFPGLGPNCQAPGDGGEIMASGGQPCEQ